MKLLVNTPSGTQEIIEVGEGGSYFDATLVLWDERTDGALPGITIGGMVRTGAALAFDQTRMDQHTAAAAALPVPQVVSIRQACRQLEIDGLLDDVEAIVAGLSKLDQIDWQRATVVERTHPLVEAVRLQKSMTPAQIDAMFIAANQL